MTEVAESEFTARGSLSWATAVGRTRTCFRPEHGVLSGLGRSRREARKLRIRRGEGRGLLSTGRKGLHGFSRGHVPAKHC